jgi:tripartite-type tricarboxylate transporter receptor subunit TctC
MHRRIGDAAAAALGLLLSWPGGTPVLAQSWPNRAITLVVPLGVGSGLDVLGRVLAPFLSEQLGQPVIVENVDGAGGMTGAYRVAKAPPDGYQFLLGTVGTHAQNQTLYKRPLYNAATDFAPVALVADQPTVLIARNTLPVDGLQGFIAYAKANQATMQYGSAGTGSAAHLACALLNAEIGLTVTHVPYRGGAPAMQDLIAGRIDYQCPASTLAIPQVEARSVKAIAILTRQRLAQLPAVRTADEQGLAGFEAGIWYAVFLPKGTPAPIIQRLHAAIVATLDAPAVAQRLGDIGVSVAAPARRSPDYLAGFVPREIDKWAAAIKASGLAAN